MACVQVPSVASTGTNTDPGVAASLDDDGRTGLEMGTLCDLLALICDEDSDIDPPGEVGVERDGDNTGDANEDVDGDTGDVALGGEKGTGDADEEDMDCDRGDVTLGGEGTGDADEDIGKRGDVALGEKGDGLKSSLVSSFVSSPIVTISISG